MLARFLKRVTRLDRPFPESLSRSELVRNLSEFVSCLEWVAASGEGNHIACDQAAKFLVALLDEVLNGSWSGSNEKYASAADKDAPSAPDDMTLRISGSENPGPQFPGADMVNSDGENFWGWFEGIDVDLNSILGEEHLNHSF